jgi:sortase A
MSVTGRFLRVASTVAVAVGLAALLYVGAVVAHAMSAASAPLTPRTAAPGGDSRRPFVAGESLGQLRIDRLGLTAAISEGERASVLRRGVGHLADSAWIGQGGNVALAGHRDTVFRSLRKIQTGDVIEIATAERSVRYRVDNTAVVAPDDLTVLEPSGRSTLTLITCYPFSYFGSAPDRFIVRAREIHP